MHAAAPKANVIKSSRYSVSGLAAGNRYGTTRRSQRHTAAATSKADALLLGALDKVLNQISRLLADHEAKQRKLRANRREAKLPGAVEAEVALPGKDVTFSAKSSAEKLVHEPSPGCVAAGRGLTQYLALPLDEYALLDPRWITRPDAVNAPDVFVLKVPLHDLSGINLEPQMTIRVRVDEASGKVHFHADGFKIGDARIDSEYSINMQATLQQKPVLELAGTLKGASSLMAAWGFGSSSSKVALPSGHSTADAQHLLPSAASLQGGPTPSAGTVDSSSSSSNGTGSEDRAMSTTGAATEHASTSGMTSNSGSDAEDQAPLQAGILHCDVSVKFNVSFPHPLAIVPGPLLSLAGGLIARLSIQSLLPQFINLLAVDYAKWASGRGSRSEAAGSLIAEGGQAGPGTGAERAEAAPAALILQKECRPHQQLQCVVG